MGKIDTIETINQDTEADLSPAADGARPDAADGAVQPDEIRAALDRVLTSPDLASSPRLSSFLRFVVETTLDGRAEEIKGYTIAVEALGRAHSFDPQTDPIVRVEATRLRRALEHFYASAGATEPLRILIPRGSYVPNFERRAPDRADTGTEDATGAEGGALASPFETPAGMEGGNATGTLAAHAARQRRTRPAWAVLMLALGLVLAAAFTALQWGGHSSGKPQAEAEAEGITLPVVAVERFEAAGAQPPAGGVLRALEERLRDAFAQFDFVEVREAENATCSGSHPLFSLATLAEGHPDGTFSLLFRLSDQCAGVIVWSRAIESLKAGDGLADSEQRMVHDVAGALMEAHGVVPVHARAQVRTLAPQSSFGCMAQAFALLGHEGGAQAPAVRSCLDDLTRKAPEFALGHALKAMVLLDEAEREAAYDPTPARTGEMLKEAERAVDLAPESAYAAQALALVQSFVGEYRAALDSGSRALRLNPFDADVAAAVGTVFVAGGRVDEGATLLSGAQAEGAARVPLKDAYRAVAAFLLADDSTAQTLLPQLALHPSRENALGLALAFHVLHRSGDEREAVAALARRSAGGADGVRRMVRHLLPEPDLAARALAALETAGLSQQTAVAKVPRG